MQKTELLLTLEQRRAERASERRYRKFVRAHKREQRHHAYHANGLNGPGALTRRFRQHTFPYRNDQRGGFVQCATTS